MNLKFTLYLIFAVLTTTRLLAAPLSGIYTIGGSNPSYATFTLAVADLNSKGVNGPVVFNVRPGTYNESIEIINFTGSSSTNTVIFQSSTGVASDVLLTYASTGIPDSWVVKLDEATYVTFNKISMQSTGTTYTRVFWLVNNSQYDTVKNCVLTAPVTTATSTYQAVLDAGEDQSTMYYNGFYNDTIYNGSYGFYCQGTGSCYIRHLLLENNVFLNQYAYGICANGQFGLIKGNLIMTNAANTGYYGIYINIAIDSLCSNKIINCPGNGIWWDNGAPNIFNNFITTTGTAATYGLTFTNMNESGTTTEIAYNSVLVLNTNPASAAFYIPTGYNQPLNFVQDNVFINRGGGYAANIVTTGEVSNPNGWGITSLFDYNDYYATGTYIGNWGGTNCTTFANWQSTVSACNCGGDSHSKNINPSFVSNTDLHITVNNLNFGNYSPRVLYDIDGQTRNTTTPDAGADEYSVQQAPQVKAAFSASATNICSNSAVVFTDQSTGSPTGWRWSFPGGTPDTSSAQLPVVIYSSPGNYPVTLVVSNANSTDSLTDTAYIHVTLEPVVYLLLGSPVCTGDTSQLIAYVNAGSLQWQLETSPGVFTNLPGDTNASYTTPPLTRTTMYRIVVTNGICIDSGYVLTQLVNPLPVVSTSIGDTTICSGDSITICALGNFSSYFWNTQDTSHCIIATQAGNYYVGVTDTNGCSAVSNRPAVDVFPVKSISLLLDGDTATILSETAVSYIWTCPGRPNVIDTLPSFPRVCSTCFEGAYCTVTDSNGCKTSTQPIICEGLPQLDESADMKLYPDPALNKFTIDITSASTDIKQVQLYDVVGRVAWSREYEHVPSGPLTVDITTLPPGIYFVLAKTGNRDYLQKLVKM